ncbi:uncharacterized protein SPPG_08420 [Spizellomyces punctatus DAOM BR117]|uniref:U3 small nucleolar RNA-associated protein 18 homolog n=1 Tax=Spizellomyces punctatus (strain DAOM BR117) TaxID=645134 RepID=A0A0L0H5M5_SPIPD|nr:uncharacterized protein SPPG_08420 [Spizellomyces punctatus DAOM BR117]KNC96269.1 hypothetical protein SPPG_08420 [Spizellomyces punctatus DAOM BR117]|eukprot:XP_016604309.1 hypothetical protein SPPG_08420 [Spizellomyces punctatus DAOM BR117]
MPDLETISQIRSTNKMTEKPSRKRKADDRQESLARAVRKEAPQPLRTEGENEEPKKKRKKKKKAAFTAEVSAASAAALPKDRGFVENSEQIAVVKDNEELELEELVFGGDVEGRMDEVFQKVGHEFDDIIEDEDNWLASARVDNDEEDIETKEDTIESGEEPENFGFFIDTDGKGAESDLPSQGVEKNHIDVDIEPEDELDQSKTLSASDLSSLPPAWEDDDDVPVNIVDTKRLRKLRLNYSEKVLSGREYESRLRQQYEKIHPTPQWALKPFREQKAGNSGDDLLRILRTTTSIVSTKRNNATLNPDLLEIVRLKDANQAAYSQSVVQSVKFHPKAPVLLTCGYDRTLRLFQVDGKINPKIQSVHIKDLPIHRATFTPDGKEVLLTGKRKFFYSYNIEAGVIQRIPGIRGRDEESFANSYVSPDNKHFAFLGRDGHIILVSKDTKQWVATMKMNGSVTAIDFSKDGKFLYSFGGDGEVYQWDLGSRKCIHKFYDDGCVKATTLAVSGGDEYLATGSDSGVVNLYDHKSCLSSSNPSPRKSILNLTTAITTLRFNVDSQILAMASRDKKDSLRLLHVPTQRIFKNWPTSQTPLGYVNCLDFSPGGGYLASGNDKGKVLLYRLSAYNAV